MRFCKLYEHIRLTCLPEPGFTFIQDCKTGLSDLLQFLVIYTRCGASPHHFSKNTLAMQLNRQSYAAQRPTMSKSCSSQAGIGDLRRSLVISVQSYQ